MPGMSSQISTNLGESKVALYSGALAGSVEVLALTYFWIWNNKNGRNK